MTASNEKSTQAPPRVLPPQWVDRVFATMLAHYGSRFTEMWRDSNVAMVKAVWAEKLGGFVARPDCIKYALDCLDGREWPPSLPEFLADCRRAPVPELKVIEHKLSADDIERNKQRAAEMAQRLSRKLSA